MYKLKINKGICDCCKCNKEVIKIGLPNTSTKDKYYCYDCICKYKYNISNHIIRASRYFKTHISVNDLYLYYDIDDLLKSLLTTPFSENGFVNLVNQQIDKNCYSFNTIFSNDVYLRLSRIYNENYFMMNPLLYCKYQKARSRIRKHSGIYCNKKISIIEYNCLLNSLNELYPEVNYENKN